MTRQWWCTTCRDQRNEPVQCAPNRCYCGHLLCPAYPSYINPRENTPAPASLTAAARTEPSSTAWADREAPTWIDKL